jgi:hypothetical protein
MLCGIVPSTFNVTVDISGNGTYWKLEPEDLSLLQQEDLRVCACVKNSVGPDWICTLTSTTAFPSRLSEGT